MQSYHGGGLKAKSTARSTKRTMTTAGIGVKMADKRTRVATSRLAEKAPPPPKTANKNVPKPPEVVDVAAATTASVGRSATGDDESVNGNDDAVHEAHEPTWTVDNYVRLLRKSLKMECQSHILNGSGHDAVQSAVTTTRLGENAVAVLVKQAMTAIQVPTQSTYYIVIPAAWYVQCASVTCIV